MAEVFAYMTNGLEWLGECILYDAEDRIHAALPHPEVKADQFIKKGGRNVSV